MHRIYFHNMASELSLSLKLFNSQSHGLAVSADALDTLRLGAHRGNKGISLVGVVS